MQRRIELLDEHHDVTLLSHLGEQHLQVDNTNPVPAAMTLDEGGDTVIKLGDKTARMRIEVKGETAYIRAFDRTFTLCIVDPVEQAAGESGGRSSIARAPMPGLIVEIDVTTGEQVTGGQPVMIIESMKILTVIKAPRDGVVAKIHFAPGQTFDKNDALVTLTEQEDT